MFSIGWLANFWAIALSVQPPQYKRARKTDAQDWLQLLNVGSGDWTQAARFEWQVRLLKAISHYPFWSFVCVCVLTISWHLLHFSCVSITSFLAAHHSHLFTSLSAFCCRTPSSGTLRVLYYELRVLFSNQLKRMLLHPLFLQMQTSVLFTSKFLYWEVVLDALVLRTVQRRDLPISHSESSDKFEFFMGEEQIYWP